MQKETQTKSPLQEVVQILANGIIRLKKKVGTTDSDISLQTPVAKAPYGSRRRTA
jgi:hypothetical protein